MIKTPKDITECRRFFGEPSSPRQRQYEALRAFYVEGAPSAEAAKRFGYAPGAFRVLCHAFRRDELPEFFSAGKPGPITQPKKSAALEKVVALRKRNYCTARPWLIVFFALLASAIDLSKMGALCLLLRGLGDLRNQRAR